MTFSASRSGASSGRAAAGGAGPPAARLERLFSADLNLLIPLLALLEERSVTEAARRLGVSQPAMSHALKRARSLLGDELLVHSHGHYVLTPHARRLIGPVRGALSRMADVLDFPAFDPARDRRTISLAATSPIAYALMPGLRALLARDAPNMVLDVHVATPSNYPSVFTDERVDVTLVPDMLLVPFLRRRLYTDEWVVVAAADHPGLRDGLGEEHLEELPHLAFDAAPHRISPYVEMDSRGLRYSIRALVSDFLLIPHLVESGGAIAFMHGRVARRLARSLRIRVHAIPFHVTPIGIDVVWNPGMGYEQVRRWLFDRLALAARQEE